MSMKKSLLISAILFSLGVTSIQAYAESAPASQQTNQSAATHDGEQGGQQPVYLPSLPAPSTVRSGVNDGYQAQFPLSDKEIQWVKSQMDSAQYSLHKGAPLRPASRVMTASIDPGSAPAVVHLMPGYVTAISVVGRDGTTWPIVTESVGSAGQFSVSSPAKSGNGISAGGKVEQSNGAPTNLLTISPNFFGATSNLVLTLKDLDTPLVVMLESGPPDGKMVDGRITLRVNRDAPDSPPPTVLAPPPSPVDTTLMSFLEGTPPKDAEALPISAVGVEMWSWGGGLIVKTRDTLVLPAWTAQVQQDGVSVYQIPMAGAITVRDAGGAMLNIVTGGK